MQIFPRLESDVLELIEIKTDKNEVTTHEI